MRQYAYLEKVIEHQDDIVLVYFVDSSKRKQETLRCYGYGQDQTFKSRLLYIQKYEDDVPVGKKISFNFNSSKETL